MLPIRLSFGFPNAHQLLRKKHSDGLKKQADFLVSPSVISVALSDDGNVDVQGHGRLHHMEMEPMKREANHKN